MAETEERSAPKIKIFGATIPGAGPPAKKTIGDGDGDPAAERRPPSKALPCPRCKSTETKFCYFNNYNVNQPRHFCKACHRYWTAGGTLRNVPFGAGRRKAKPQSDGGCAVDRAEAGALPLEEAAEQWVPRIMSASRATKAAE